MQKGAVQQGAEADEVRESSATGADAAMGLLNQPETPVPPEVSSTRAMRVALYLALPALAAGLGEGLLSVIPRMATLEWLVASTFLAAMLSRLCALPLIGAMLWATQQEQLAALSKLILWVVVALALGLTLVIPERVVNKKYYVCNPRGDAPGGVVQVHPTGLPSYGLRPATQRGRTPDKNEVFYGPSHGWGGQRT